MTLRAEKLDQISLGVAQYDRSCRLDIDAGGNVVFKKASQCGLRRTFALRHQAGCCQLGVHLRRQLAYPRNDFWIERAASQP